MKYDRIRSLREDNDFSQKEIAEKLFINRRTYCGYENGTRNLSPEILINIAKIYGVTVDYLLGLTDNPKIN